MTYNVGWDSIFPEDTSLSDEWRNSDQSVEFERILTATAPDVICLQEINPSRDPQRVAEILDTVLPLANDERWRAHSGQDKVLVARFDPQMCDSVQIQPGTITGFGHAMAMVDLPDGDYAHNLYILCAHFKAQGGQSNVEARVDVRFHDLTEGD
jgi:hypothetical protein